jgi:D-sedoheptulose 7-phosphate isomerase
MINSIKDELLEAQQVLDNFLNNEKNLIAISQAAEIITASLQTGNKIISCGNGGSHCDAMHFAEELSGRFREDRPALAAFCISDASHISCVGNDYGFDYIFSRGVEALGNKDDILLAISTSGNSKNVIEAVHAARKKGLKTIALTGKNGGALAELADHEIRVAHHGYADRIQEIHIKIIHILILQIEKQLGYAG